jgi:hypothetical protein
MFLVKEHLLRSVYQESTNSEKSPRAQDRVLQRMLPVLPWLYCMLSQTMVTSKQASSKR